MSLHATAAIGGHRRHRARRAAHYAPERRRPDRARAGGSGPPDRKLLYRPPRQVAPGTLPGGPADFPGETPRLAAGPLRRQNAPRTGNLAHPVLPEPSARNKRRVGDLLGLVAWRAGKADHAPRQAASLWKQLPAAPIHDQIIMPITPPPPQHRRDGQQGPTIDPPGPTKNPGHKWCD